MCTEKNTHPVGRWQSKNTCFIEFRRQKENDATANLASRTSLSSFISAKGTSQIQIPRKKQFITMLCNVTPCIITQREEKAIRPKKSVTFRPRIAIRGFLTHPSERDRNAAFYSELELSKIKKRNLRVLHSLDGVPEFDDMELEVLKNIYALQSIKSRTIRREKIQQNRFDVLYGQVRQRPENHKCSIHSTNFEYMLQISTSKSLQEAQERDIQVAQAVVSDDDTCEALLLSLEEAASKPSWDDNTRDLDDGFLKRGWSARWGNNKRATPKQQVLVTSDKITAVRPRSSSAMPPHNLNRSTPPAA
jgi:hypothetical protein